MKKGFTVSQSLVVSKAGITVGELFRSEGRGLYFTYDKDWLAKGFNLSPLTMAFDEKPQLARNLQTFNGLHGPFADSLPDGWGMLLMDRFFNAAFGDGTALTLNMLDRLAYIGDRGMGAFEYHPKTDNTALTSAIDISELFLASQAILEGETADVLAKLRLAGGSPGGARPKVVAALSADQTHATSAFGSIPDDYEHWIIKFRAGPEPIETGAMEYAYAQLARNSGVEVPQSCLLHQPMSGAPAERFFATKRFDRENGRKRHMISVAALLYADHRAPTMDYSQMLKLTHVLTNDAVEVEKMARLMIFNALSHNYDDHTKNFAFLCNEPEQPGADVTWSLAPAYDLTFTEARGEHSTAFAGRGKATRQIIKKLCADFKYLKPDEYIDQTLDALTDWREVLRKCDIPVKAGEGIFRVLEQVRKDFERG
ncbi:MAG: type II toxin-antitoxin system HipA family toxin [Pseudomonas sp.]|uniref:type II toxin-antitoxin system HipA family toxin n=1 Tax=Pseudomonas sp. TaxID=306 RepID=UPI003D0D5A81